MNFKKKRKQMVEFQIKSRGITDQQVLDAFLDVKREQFVPETKKFQAYDDRPLAIGNGQTISQPYIVALMVSLLKLSQSDTVLEIGTGSGYQTAILSKIAKKVYSIERYQSLAETAEENLKKTDISNYEIMIGDGTKGWKTKQEKEIKFNAIIVSAATQKIPSPLKQQLAKDGRLVIPVGPRFSQELIRLTKTGEDKFMKESFGGCVFVPLIGEFGWQN